MKKFNDILIVEENFFTRKEQYLNLNYEFYLNLIKQIGKKGEIPNGGLLKYKSGTRDNINIVEEWIEFNDDESCSMQIGIVTNNLSHDIHFSTKIKQKSNLTLSVTTDINVKQFEFDLMKQKVQEINFDDVVEYIFETLIKFYDNWKLGN